MVLLGKSDMFKYGNLAIFLFAVAHSVAAHAETVLTITGNSLVGERKTVELSMQDLTSLPQAKLLSMNDFVEKETVFEGPLLRDALAGFSFDRDTVVRATAANDYFVDIPANEILDYRVILAVLMDGKGMSLRDKGPIWVIYPMEEFTDDTTPSTSVVNNRLIWQLISLDVR